MNTAFDYIFFGLLGIVISTLLVAIFVGFLFILVMWMKSRERHRKSLESIMLEVALPRENEIKIDAAEQMFASLTSLKKPKGIFSFLHVPDSISFEIVAKAQDIRFYVVVHKKLADMVEKQIHGAYPDAQIEEVEEENLFAHQGRVAYAGLKLDEADYKPINTYQNLATDPLSTLTSIMGKMQDGEAAIFQMIISPGGKEWKSGGRHHISSVKKKEANPEKASYDIDQKELEAIEQKLTKPGFNTFVRLVVASTSTESAEAHLQNLIGAFNQYSSYNKFVRAKVRFFRGMFITDFVYRYLPLLRKGSTLTTEELATIFHLPNKTVESPYIHWLTARSAPAPNNIATSGLYLGKSKYRGTERPVYIDRDDRRRHMYIIGKTGTGKSEFLKSMIFQDINNGEGLAVIDPHGDLIEDILLRIPPKRAEDVILFDPSDTERPIGINMLAAATEEQKHFVVNSIIGLMTKLFDPNQTGIIGPRFEHNVRNAMLTVMTEENATLIEVMRVITDPTYLKEILPKVQDPMVKRYWTDQIAQTNDFHKSEILDYIVSKFGRFITNTMMRNIIGQSTSAFDFRRAMDEQKIMLVNLAKGKIGEENSNFLGLILVPRILVAAMSRQDIPQSERRDFYLYVDEFQNFATPDFAQILSEARKYRLNLTVANQFTGQMQEDIKNAIFGNVGTIASFRVGVSDANYLQHEFQPRFSEADLINIERYHAYMRTIVDGEPAPPFSIDLTRNVDEEKKLDNSRVAELVRELSRLKYGRPKAIVEAEIAKRSKLMDVPQQADSREMPGEMRRT